MRAPALVLFASVAFLLTDRVQAQEVTPWITISPTVELAYANDAWTAMDDGGPGGEIRVEAYGAKGWSVAAIGAVNFTSAGPVDVNHWKGMGELRKSFPETGSVSPYLGFRLGLLHQSARLGKASGSDNAFVFGPAGGVTAKLSPRTALDFGASYYWAEFMNAPIGSALSIRAGMSFALTQ